MKLDSEDSIFSWVVKNTNLFSPKSMSISARFIEPVRATVDGIVMEGYWSEQSGSFFAVYAYGDGTWMKIEDPILLMNFELALKAQGAKLTTLSSQR